MEMYCINCGKKFVAKTNLETRKFCSTVCRHSFAYKTKQSAQKPPKPIYKKKCLFCDKTFWTTVEQKKYCCIKCRTKANAEKAKHTGQNSKSKIETGKTLEDYAREADECGLSYGKYKAQLRLGKTFEELKAEYDRKRCQYEDC